MVYGLWFMVYGLGFMVYGLWFIVRLELDGGHADAPVEVSHHLNIICRGVEAVVVPISLQRRQSFQRFLLSLIACRGWP